MATERDEERSGGGGEAEREAPAGHSEGQRGAGDGSPREGRPAGVKGGAAIEREAEGMGMGMGEARLSFQKQRGAIEAIEASATVTLKVDVRRVAALAHSVGLRDAVPGRRAVFERLAAAGFYTLTTLDALPHQARAAWYARRQYVFSARESSGAIVPEETAREAYATRARMQRVLEYWFGDDEKIGARLRSIREGAGRLDLASDLEELGGLYAQEDLKRVLEGDGKHYRPADAADALRLAGALFGGFGVGAESEAERWAGLSQRATTLLMRTYDEHRRAGQFAFARGEDVATTYPSLIGAARGAQAKRPAVEAPSGDEDETPVDGG